MKQTRVWGIGIASFALLLLVATYLILTGSTPIAIHRTPVVFWMLVLANYLTLFALLAWVIIAIGRWLMSRR